jgi:hypothetical protein
MYKIKKRILKAAKGKSQITYNGRPISITLDFSTETLKTKASANVLYNLRDHRCQLRVLYQAQFSFTIDGETKIFHVKIKFKQCLLTNSALQKIVEGKIKPTRLTTLENTRNK